MNFQEILASQGLTKKQYDAVKIKMLQNRIFITKEEKIEERYQKLKRKRQMLEEDLENALERILVLTHELDGKEKRISYYEKRERSAAQMQKEYRQNIIGHMISSVIYEKLAGAKYPELLAEKFDKSKIYLHFDGQVEGIEEQLKEIKAAYKELFPFESEKNKEADYMEPEIHIASNAQGG